MINAKLDHCKTIEEFYISIRDQQEEAHGNDYCEQHDALMKYAADCVTYAELGTHQGGTLANKIVFKIKEMDSGSLDSIGPRVDMLLIDSYHKAYHMQKELKVHANRVNKYIIAHDTRLPTTELDDCLTEFCFNNPGWKVIERGESNVGYMVLKRDG